MGLDASATLVYGIPLAAYDNDGEPTFWWDEDAEDWRDIPKDHEHNLAYEHYGYYDGDPQVILTSPRIENWTAYAGEECRVDPPNVEMLHDKALSKATDSLRAMECPEPETFYGEAGWYLIASYG
jgi:hypothetical protein